MFPTLRSKSILALVALGLFTGCAGDAKQPTSKEAAHLKWNATRAAVLANLAKDQFESANFDKARQSLTEALKLDPENASIRALSAKLAIEQNQLEMAEKELRLARQFDPKN